MPSPESSGASPWRNLPAKPNEQTSAGVCGMHGVYIGCACPECVDSLGPDSDEAPADYPLAIEEGAR